MNKQRLMLTAGLAMAFLLTMIPAAALLRAEAPAKPMQSHDFTDVPVTGQEFMEPYIDAFYHQGITGGCSTSPLQYCPTNPVTRGSMAVFMGRALGYVDAENAGHNTRAYFKQTTEGAAYHGVIGESIDGRGVWGISELGNGVRGDSFSNSGVSGTSTNQYGVRGLSENTFGVFALSTNQTALFVRGETANADSSIDFTNDIELGGDLGEIYSNQMHLFSDGSLYLHIDADSNSLSNLIVANGVGDPVFLINEDGDTSASGTKSAIVDTVSHGTRKVYAVESPEVWFEDIGRGQLIDGEAVIDIEDIFAETVNLDEDYEVFLTPIDGWADLYVTNMTATSFTVRAADGSDIAFSYRIIAKRLGYEDVRLEEVDGD